ncbi:MAG TPA: SDR family NAD(P)-dependent oxidoreductase [Propionibacteriaceae bacterium]
MNRVVLVTGASSGIGRATAREAARRGDHVVLVARGIEPLEEAAGECRELGAASARAVALDITDAEALEALAAQLQAELGRVDAVIHSAGVVAYGRLEEVPADVYAGVIQTNVLGSVNVVRAVLPHMRERNSGHIVLIGSLIGHIAPPYMSAYAISKWAVRGLARELVIENRDRPGVHIGIVAPGGVDTPIYVQAANYLGQVGRPPPPVVSPEKVAHQAMRLLDHPRARVQVGAANRLIIAGFGLFPAVFDAIVTPMFLNGATDKRHPVGAGSGNVLGSVPKGNRPYGGQGSPVGGIAGNLLTTLRNRARGR